MIRLLTITLLGAGIGALLGSTRSCRTGGCPLTSTPLRGAIYGAVLAGFIGLAMTGPATGGNAKTETAAESPHFIHIHSADDFSREVAGSRGVVLLDFYADWCGPCRQLLPVMSRLADALAGEVKVVKVNVDEFGDIAREYGVSSIPDIRLFVDGKEKEHWVGGRTENFYLEQLAPYRQVKSTPGVTTENGKDRS